MESLNFSPRKLSSGDLLKGLGGSVVFHLAVVTLAVIIPWAMPKKAIQPAFTTVNLVSMQDVAGAAPKKGLADYKGPEGKGTQETVKSNATAPSKPGPVVPVKRLRLDDSVKKTEPEIKKIEPRETPKVAETQPNDSSVEKSLDKLITKPKPAPKPSPAAETATARSGQPEQTAAKNAGAASQENPARGNPKGVPEGHPKGTADNNARGIPEATGSANGGAVNSALLALYGDKVKKRINENWSILETLKTSGLETRLVVVVNRDGKLLDLQVEKPSGNGMFDESALRAVRKAAPLPPVPETYTLPKIEFGITFRPSGAGLS